MIQERIAALRSLMAERQIDAYMIPTSDFHESEYVGDYFKCRKFINLFTNLLKYIIIKLIFLQKATKRVLCSAAFFMRINFMH